MGEINLGSPDLTRQSTGRAAWPESTENIKHVVAGLAWFVVSLAVCNSYSINGPAFGEKNKLSEQRYKTD